MQKGKRYKDTLGQTWRFTHTSGDGVTLYFKVEGSTTLLSHPVPPHDLKWLVDSGQWVELPDERFFVLPPGTTVDQDAIRRMREIYGLTEVEAYAQAGIPESMLDPRQYKKTCTHTNPDGSLAWVNYTPYHDASSRAKFACRKCDRERD